MTLLLILTAHFQCSRIFLFLLCFKYFSDTLLAHNLSCHSLFAVSAIFVTSIIHSDDSGNMYIETVSLFFTLSLLHTHRHTYTQRNIIYTFKHTKGYISSANFPWKHNHSHLTDMELISSHPLPSHSISI